MTTATNTHKDTMQDKTYSLLIRVREDDLKGLEPFRGILPSGREVPEFDPIPAGLVGVTRPSCALKLRLEPIIIPWLYLLGKHSTATSNFQHLLNIGPTPLARVGFSIYG